MREKGEYYLYGMTILQERMPIIRKQSRGRTGLPYGTNQPMKSKRAIRSLEINMKKRKVGYSKWLF